MKADVVIIGAGLAGTCSAIVLAKAGYDVVLVDTHAEYPAEFRAEKMGPPQMEQFTRLGLADVVRENVTAVNDIWIARYGHVLSKERRTEYAFHYPDLVNGLRRALPAGVTLKVGRVADVSTSDDLQSVTLAGGETCEARLLVVATGLGDTIRSKVGVERIRLSRAHSLSLGFSLAVEAKHLPFDSLVYYGETLRDRVAYCAIFPTSHGTRANLFVYRTAGDEWVKEFRQSPGATLRKTLPGLSRVCPTLDVTGAVALRSIDLTEAHHHRRAGVVVIGDAFRTCCPIPGVGILKVLTDVERLCLHHCPGWFETPGMADSKISAFYDDPIKQRCDAKGHASSVYARALTTDPSLPWAARRLRNAAVRRGHFAVNEALSKVFGRKAHQSAGAQAGAPVRDGLSPNGGAVS